MIKLKYNETTILICEQQVLSRLNIEHQHIIIMHMENRYKWKPIREKTTSYYCCDAKASSNSLSPLIFCRLQSIGGYYLKFCKIQLARKIQLPSVFCRLQPTGGSYLSQLQMDIYQATTWNGSTNSHVFSVGYNPQEAPTSTNYNWTSIMLQLDMEAPTSSHNTETTCWFTWISAPLYSFFIAVLYPSYLPYLISWSLQLLFLLLLLLPLSSLMPLILLSLKHIIITSCIEITS